MATLYDLAESMIDDEAKEKWLKQYLAEPANFNKFMELMLRFQCYCFPLPYYHSFTNREAR